MVQGVLSYRVPIILPRKIGTSSKISSKTLDIWEKLRDAF
jgi:hypothetical protein